MQVKIRHLEVCVPSEGGGEGDFLGVNADRKTRVRCHFFGWNLQRRFGENSVYGSFCRIKSLVLPVNKGVSEFKQLGAKIVKKTASMGHFAG